jgi:RND superfamily putative drug exporter
MFRQAFPDDQMRSTLVLIARRESDVEGLQPSDFDYLAQQVLPELHKIVGLPMPNREIEEQEQSGDTAAEETAEANIEKSSATKEAKSARIVQSIAWFEDRKVGDLLISEDKQATSIVFWLTTEFLNQANVKVVNSVEQFVKDLSRIPSGQANSLPPGLEIAVSGSATFGRDMMQESSRSAKSTEDWTVILVVVLLIAIYRAPMLAIIPLITVGEATTVSRKLLAIGESRASVVASATLARAHNAIGLFPRAT